MSVITLDQAKLYLRLDDPLDDQTEAELQTFIDAAERFFAKRTGWALNPTKKKYWPDPYGVIRVYDHPILSELDGYRTEEKNMYVAISSTEPVELEIGYQAASEVPDEFVNACLQLLKIYYYESESMEKVATQPPIVHQIIETYKRFVT